jgi:hypothetical protein
VLVFTSLEGDEVHPMAFERSELGESGGDTPQERSIILSIGLSGFGVGRIFNHFFFPEGNLVRLRLLASYEGGLSLRSGRKMRLQRR